MKGPTFWLLALAFVLGMAFTSCTCGGGGGDDDGDTDDDTDDDANDDIGEPPDAPSGLAAEGQGEDIALSWKDNSDDEEGFRVYRREHGIGSFGVIVELGLGETGYTDSELGLDKDYEYKAVAFNSYGESKPSNIARAQTKPNAPTYLTAAGSGQDVDLLWEDNSNVEMKFRIYRRPIGGSFSLLTTVGADVASYSDSGIGPEKDYEYKVTASNDAGESDDSNVARAQTVPSAPTGFIATGSGQDIDLSWTDNSQLEDGFYVYRRPYGSGSYTNIATLGADASSYQDAAGAEKDYQYKVTAFNDAGESDDSNVARAQTIPSAPTGLIATGTGQDINLTWTDNSQVESGFYIYRRSYGSENFTQIAAVGANATNYTDNAGPEKDYEYKVSAYNLAGEAESNIARAQTLIPNAPTNLIDFPKKYKTLLNWQDNSNIEEGYRLERKFGEDSWEQIADLPANTTSYTDTDLNCDTWYWYRVKAYNGAGNSDYSNTDFVETLECWTIHTIGYGYGFTDIALDSNNKVHISYYDWNTEGLAYATNSFGSWQTFIIDVSGEMGGGYTSVALDSNNKVHISYYEWGTIWDLKYATNISGSWQTFTIDPGSVDAGRDSSIAIDSHDNVHISYYSASSNYDLNYATNKTGSWQLFIIDPGTWATGLYNSIAIDSTDAIHISYCEQDKFGQCRLKYATNSSGVWQIYKIDSGGDVGGYTSIAIDSNDKVHISYDTFPSQGGGGLYYATNITGSWQTTYIPDPHDALSTSIAVDCQDKIHIAAYDIGNDAVWYATNTSGSWQTSIVDIGSLCNGTSIAIDSEGNVHISYEGCPGAIKYATNAEE